LCCCSQSLHIESSHKTLLAEKVICYSAKIMDDKHEEIVILETVHISHYEQSIIQYKKVSEESTTADHKKVELRKVFFTKKLKMPTISNLICCGECNSPEIVKEEQTLENSEGPQDWQIREWNAELRENKICLNELNLRQKTEKQKKVFELIEAEQVRKEAAIQEKENEAIVRKHSLERKESEIEEKNKLLEIAIRVNEISLESQVEDLEQKSDVSRHTSGMLTRRTYYTPVGNKNSEIDLNSVETGDNSTQGSDETNSPSSH
jgi:hypothetical protein